MKKIVSMALLGIMLFSTGMNVMAKEEKLPEIDEKFLNVVLEQPEVAMDMYDNIEKITTVVVPESIQNQISATLMDEDGEVEDLDCEVFMVQIDFAQPYALSDADNVPKDKMYVLNASVKESPGSLTEDGITLNGTIGWIDHFGTGNEFRYVSGSRSGAYVGSGTYGYGGKGEAYRGGTSFESTFSDTTGSGNKNSWFYLHVYSKTTAGKTITLNVGTSILD